MLMVSLRVAMASEPPLVIAPVLINVSALSHVPWSLRMVPSLLSVVLDWMAT